MMIVNFNKYKKKREKKRMDIISTAVSGQISMFSDITDEIRKDGQSGKNFSLEEISNFAQKILNLASYYTKTITPINRIAEDFGIIPYRTYGLQEGISGVIYAGGTTKKIYGIDKVILVDKNEPEKHQRFVIAHEIAHYLFDCVTNAEYNDGKKLFAETYPKENHDSPKELKANRFAAELLMPTDLFIKQYYLAMAEKNNNYMFTITYLSEFFGTKMSSIEKRINEVFN